MAAFNIQEALIWKEKIEQVIDQVIIFYSPFEVKKDVLKLILSLI